jgi:hypothetical protein
LVKRKYPICPPDEAVIALLQIREAGDIASAPQHQRNLW